MSLHFLLFLVGDADGIRAGGAKIGPYLRPLIALIAAKWRRSRIEREEVSSRNDEVKGAGRPS
jgi:hypothetical protein